MSQQCMVPLDLLIARSCFLKPNPQASMHLQTCCLCGMSCHYLFQCVLATTFLRGGTDSTASCTNQNTLTCFGVQGATLSVPPRFAYRVVGAQGPSACSYGKILAVAYVYLWHCCTLPVTWWFGTFRCHVYANSCATII